MPLPICGSLVQALHAHCDRRCAVSALHLLGAALVSAASAAVVAVRRFWRSAPLGLGAAVVLIGIGVIAMSAAGSDQGQPPQAPQPPAAPPQYSADLKVGDVAPEFALMGSDGKVHKLSDYRGKTVVLAWFPKAFTGG